MEHRGFKKYITLNLVLKAKAVLLFFVARLMDVKLVGAHHDFSHDLYWYILPTILYKDEHSRITLKIVGAFVFPILIIKEDKRPPAWGYSKMGE